jgi:amino acid transporter
MPKKQAKQKLDMRLIIIGFIAGLSATFSMMCIPCIFAAFPQIPLFFAVLGGVALFFGRNSWVFILIGLLLIAAGFLLQMLSKKKVCKR